MGDWQALPSRGWPSTGIWDLSKVKGIQAWGMFTLFKPEAPTYKTMSHHLCSSHSFLYFKWSIKRKNSYSREWLKGWLSVNIISRSSWSKFSTIHKYDVSIMNIVSNRKIKSSFKYYFLLCLNINIANKENDIHVNSTLQISFMKPKDRTKQIPKWLLGTCFLICRGSGLDSPSSSSAGVRTPGL